MKFRLAGASVRGVFGFRRAASRSFGVSGVYELNDCIFGVVGVCLGLQI